MRPRAAARTTSAERDLYRLVSASIYCKRSASSLKRRVKRDTHTDWAGDRPALAGGPRAEPGGPPLYPEFRAGRNV